jgi:hypothetical protein
MKLSVFTWAYPSTLANSTLIKYYFQKCWNFQKKNSSKITKYCEGKYWILRNIPFVEMTKVLWYSSQNIINDYNFNMKCKANMI